MFKKLCILFSLFILTIGCAGHEYVKDIAEIAPAAVIEEAKAEEAARVVEVAKVAIIKGTVLFDFDKFNIDVVAAITLEKIVTEMENAPDTLLILKGHTDKHGSNSYNQVLSENRANAVEMYLVKAGVPAKNIVGAEGFGETLLIPGATDHQNRRVLILTVDDK